MKKFPISRITVLFSIILAFSSCKNPLTPSTESNTSNQYNKNDLITLTFTTTGLPESATKSNSRSATSSDLANLKYEVIAIATGFPDDFPKGEEVKPLQAEYALNEKLELQVYPNFIYDITINAFYRDPSDEKFIIFTETKNNINPLEKQDTPLSYKLKPYTESSAPGSLTLPFKVSGGSFTGYKISITFLNKSNNSGDLEFYTGEETTFPTINKADFSSGYTLNIPSIKPGTYGMNISIYNNEEKIIFVYPTIFTIYPGMQTTTWVDEPLFVNDSGEFTFTKEIENSFNNTTFYVRGSGGNLSFPENSQTAQDTNKGTAYEPFATLSRALEQCTSTTQPYTIYVDGVIEESARMDITANKKIFIRGLSNKAIIKRIKKADYTDIKSLLTIYEKASVEFRDITFNGNGDVAKASDDGAFIHNIGGILTFENCIIADFKTESSSGGAIFSNNGSIRATNCQFLRNAVNSSMFGNGGAVYIRADGATTTKTNYFTNCQFMENKANTTKTSGSDGEYGAGGAIFVGEKNNIIISGENTLFQSNSATFGGAINVIDTDPQVSITDAIFNECSAEKGGAIFQVNISNINLTNVNITECSVTVSGGAIYANGKITAEGCKFAGNQAISSTVDTYGGALYIKGSNNSDFKNCTIGRCTIDDTTYGPNVAQSTGEGKFGKGGAIYCESAAIFDNCIIGNENLATQDFAGSTEQVTEAQCAHEDTAGNISDGSIIHIASSSKTVLQNGTKVCYNYSKKSIFVIEANKSINIGIEDDSNIVEVFGNGTDPSEPSDSFIAVLENKGISRIYGKIHHNYINNCGGTILNDETAYLYMYGPNSHGTAEICYNNQAKKVASLPGSIANKTIKSGTPFCNYGATIKGNYSATSGQEIYEIYHVGSYINISTTGVVGTPDDPSPYNSIYLGTYNENQTKIDIGTLYPDFVARITVPTYSDDLEVLTDTSGGADVSAHYNKFKMANPAWYIKPDGKITSYENALTSGTTTFENIHSSEQINNLLQAIQTKNETNEITLKISEDFTTGETVYNIPENANVTLTADEPVTIHCSNTKESSTDTPTKTYWYSFEVNTNSTLTIGNNITLDGGYNGEDTNKRTLLNIVGGTVIMETGAKITNFLGCNGNGLMFIDNGEFIMNGGEISGNNCSNYTAIAYLYDSTSSFTINSGEIKNNYVSGINDGVLFGREGTLVLNGGTIVDNTQGNNNKWIAPNMTVTKGANFALGTYQFADELD